MAQIIVMVAAYNAEPYIRRALDSILAQTFRDFDIIVVDDGSKDATGAIADAYAARDSRVHVIHQQNAGLSAARNVGMDWAFANTDGEWITFIDSDDWVHPQYLERLLDAAVKQNVSVSVCGFAETDGKGPEICPETLEPVLWTPADFYRQRFVNATIACAKLYRKCCFETIRYPVGKLHEDEFVTYRLLFAQEHLAVISAPLYAYFINQAGITKGAWSPRRLDAWEAYEQQIAFFKAQENEALVQFRIRGFLENALVNLRLAQEVSDSDNLLPEIKKIKRKIRSLIRMAWKHGCIQFWPDFEILYQYYPFLTRVYRLWLELRR